MTTKNDLASLGKVMELYRVDHSRYVTQTFHLRDGLGRYKISDYSAYAQHPTTPTNLTMCFSDNGEEIAIITLLSRV